MILIYNITTYSEDQWINIRLEGARFSILETRWEQDFLQQPSCWESEIRKFQETNQAAEAEIQATANTISS